MRVFGTPYHEMASERLLSIHHELQTHCIINVNTCIKRLDDKTIVFCGSLQILKYYYKKKLYKMFAKERKGKIYKVRQVVL